MYAMFVAFAVIGGAVFLVQFALAVFGLGGDDLDVGGDLPDDLDMDFDVGDAGDGAEHGSSWLFGVISLRTIVAAVLFFGLAGAASMQAGLNEAVSILIAVAAGGAAMYVVYWVMHMLYRLTSDGTTRIENSLDHEATVYVPIPAEEAGLGKVNVRVNDQIREYQAMTSGPDALPTGASVKVVGVVNESTLRVEPLRQQAPAGQNS